MSSSKFYYHRRTNILHIDSINHLQITTHALNYQVGAKYSARDRRGQGGRNMGASSGSGPPPGLGGRPAIGPFHYRSQLPATLKAKCWEPGR